MRLETDDLPLLRAKAAYLVRLRGYHDKYLKRQST